MLVQLLFNKNKLATSGNKILVDVCESIENKVCCIKGKSNNYDSINNINSSIDEFRTIVYDKGESNYYLTKEAKIKTDKMDNTGNIDKNMDKKGKTTILAKEENIIPSKTLDNATENKVENVEFKSAILNWPEIPNAVMYELIVKNIDTQEVLFTKYNIYASGYQLDNSEVNLSQNLKWQVRGLDENKVPVSDYTKPRLLHKGEMYKLNWQNK